MRLHLPFLLRRAVLKALFAVGGLFATLSSATYGDMITPDGRTDTTVLQQGNVYNVYTGTVRGDVGFNSFSTFDVYAGTTANLHLADGTGNNIAVSGDYTLEARVITLRNITVQDGKALTGFTLNAANELADGSFAGEVSITLADSNILAETVSINATATTLGRMPPPGRIWRPFPPLRRRVTPRWMCAAAYRAATP